MRYLALLLCVALSASAAVEHPDGSATITKDEKEAILAHVKMLVEQIEIRDKLLEAEKAKAKPGRCV
jgi:hypothetical protein